MNWSVVFSLVLFVKTIEGGLISQSSIQSCDWGDSNEPTTKDGGGCKEKFVISMTLKSGQGEVEALYANINQVHTSADSGPSTLKKPFRIEVQKSQTITNYRVYYRGSVNGLPHEHTIIFSHAGHCHDGWYERHLSCGKQRSLDSSEEFAWDSQGFCCKCSSYVTEIRRSKGVCIGGLKDWLKHKFSTGYTTYHPGRKMNFGSSAHCMRMDNLWYDVYDIELPNMLYNITVRLLQYEGRVMNVETGVEMTNWTTISTFFLTPSKTMGRSKDGKVVVELQGDLVGANGPRDFSVKKLLIPSLKVWKFDENPEPPAAYTNGPGDWLLVDDHLVDLSGQQCNKVGVSYTGFKRQNSPCDKPEHSCFTNQPLQLWRHDDELRSAGKPGIYMVHNFGQVHPSTHVNNHSFILRFIHTDLHNSFVTFRIDASDIVFVYNAAKGRIVDAYATDFTAVKEVGHLYVEVENTGQLESEYSIVLSECLGRKSTPSKVVTILPGCIANVSFSLQSYKTKGENSLCEVQLYDKSFNLLGTTKVDVAVKGACFCFGECGCTCGSETGSIGNSTALPCATPPPVIIHKSNLARDIFLLVLESIGIHGIVGFFGGILLVLGCMKLMCGGILCCRKTKAQEHYDNLVKKGVDPKSPLLVKCTGECRGAKAAQARYKRKIERLKKIGKDPGLLDDWRNTSFVCGCREELADIRFAYIIKAVCFFYFCFFLPFIWLGKKIWWTVFKDTAAKKEAAEKAVLNQAKKKGKLEKYGVIDIAAELMNVEEERNQLRGETGKKQKEDTAGCAQKVEDCIAGENVEQSAKKKTGYEKGGKDNFKTDSKSKKDEKKQQHKSDKDRKPKAKSYRKGVKDMEENLGLKKEKQLGQGAMGMKDTKENVEFKEKQLGEGTRPKDKKCERKKEQPLQKENTGYGEGSRAQGRSRGRSTVGSGMKSNKQRSTSGSRDDKQLCERMPGKSTVKTKELKTPKSTKSNAASHDYEHGKQLGRQSSVKSEESLSLKQSAISHTGTTSKASIPQLDDNTITENDKDRVESADDARKDSHTSLASVDHSKPDDKTEQLSTERSVSSQEGSPSRKASVNESKSDMSSKSLERESDASPVSDPHHDNLDVVSPHHSEEIKPTSSHQSEVATEPVFSQHSDMVKSQHSDATMPLSSQQSFPGTPPQTGHTSSSSIVKSMRSVSRESSVRVQRVHSDQFAVRYLSGGRISVVVQSSSHESHNSNTQAHSHSEELKQHQSSPSVERQSMDSVNSSKGSGSRICMYSDPSLSASSKTASSSTNTSSNSATSFTHSGSTSSTKSSFTSSASSSSAATGTSSYDSSGQTSSSSHDSDISKTGDSHRTLSNQLLNVSSSGSHASGMVTSQHSESSVNSDELQESSVSSHDQRSEDDSRSEATYTEGSEEFHNDEHVSTSSSSEQEPSQESHSEITESGSYTSTTSQQSTTYSSSSRSQSETSPSHSGSSARSKSSESSSSAEMSHDSHSQ